MATTKAFELAQLSALTSVDASGNVTTNTSQIANASGNLTIDSVADIILNADGADIILADDAVDFGRFKRDAGDFVIKSETANKDLIFKGVKSGSPDTTITALTLDMQNDGRATFSENVVVAGTITGVTTLTASGVISTSNTTGSTNTSTGALIVGGGAGIGENLNVAGNIVVTGDLTVEGTSVTLNTTNLSVEDKNITLNYHASNDTSSSAGGSGITIQDAVDASNDASILWDAGNDEFDISHSMKIAGSIGVTNIVTNKVVKFDGTILDDSNITDTGSLITLGSNTTASANLSIGGATATTAILSIPGADTTTKPQIRFISGIGTSLADAAISTTDDSGGTNVLIGSNLYYSNATITRFTASRSGSAIDFGYTGNMKFYTGTGNAAPTEKVRIAADGAVNWSGTHSSFVGQLRATDTSNAMINAVNELAFYTNNAGVRAMHIDSTGKVGIGTADPQDRLHVALDSSITNAEVEVIRVEATSSGTPAVGFGPFIDFRGDRINGGPDSYGRLGFEADAMPSTTVDGAFVVQTAEDGNYSERLRIGSDGNVGIGTNGSPNSYVDETTLTINGTSFGRLDLEAGGTLRSSLFSGSTYTALTVGTSRIQVESSSDIKFNTQNDIKLIVKNAGNVGIGTADPVQTLDVDGSIGTRQVRHSVRPSLNLDFANSKELDPRITFHRNSRATYYDSRGLLRYANINEPRFDHNPYTGESKGLLIEEPRTNIKNFSENENFLLGTDLGGILIPNYAKSPSGKMNAFALFGDGNTSARASTGTTGAGTYTLSVYAKNNATNSAGRFGIWAYSGGWVYSNTFTWNGDTVTPSSATNTKVEIIGDGWVRVHATWTTTGNGSFQLSPGAYANYATGDSTLFFGLNLVNIGSNSGSYIPPDTSFTSRASSATYRDETGIIRTAPAQIPRYGYEYDGRKWVETGLILEAASSNMLYHSTKGSDLYGDVLAAEALWTITDSSIDVSAPDGGKFTTKGVSGTSGNSWYWQVSPFSYTNGTTYTHSAWVRTAAGTTGTVSMNVYPQTLANGGTAATSITATDEWQRVSVTFPYNSGLGSPYIGFVSPQQSRTFYFWGWQIEAKNQPTSYISTLGSAVTRAADVAVSTSNIVGKDLVKIEDITYQDWYNTREGTIYTDFHALSSSDDIVVGIGDGTSRGFRAPWLTGATQLRQGTWSGTAYSALHYYNSIVATDPHKTALSFSYSTLDVSGNINGTVISSLDGSTAAVTNSWAGVETDATTMWIGSETDTARFYNGHIRKIAIYNEALGTAELQALTENN